MNVKPTSQMTVEDARMVAYFVREKGDITRWVDWPNRQDAIAYECPELINALTLLEKAERTLDAVLSDILDRFEDAEEAI
jgi:predicted nucleic acid-binding protein